MSDFNVQSSAMILLHRKVAVKVQSLSLLLEMNNLDDEQRLPVDLVANLTIPIPVFDLSNPKVINDNLAYRNRILK